MKRFLIPAVLAFGAVTLLGLQPASSGAGSVSGTVTATPATIEAGETVDIVLEGDCYAPAQPRVEPAEHGGSHHVIATITDPNGAVAFTQTYEGAPTIEFTFSDTPTVGTYTVTAACDIDCEISGNAEPAQVACEESEAGAAEVIGSYTPGEFTVVEGEAAAADAEPADVVAATPTFTG